MAVTVTEQAEIDALNHSIGSGAAASSDPWRPEAGFPFPTERAPWWRVSVNPVRGPPAPPTGGSSL